MPQTYRHKIREKDSSVNVAVSMFCFCFCFFELCSRWLMIRGAIYKFKVKHEAGLLETRGSNDYTTYYTSYAAKAGAWS